MSSKIIKFARPTDLQYDGIFATDDFLKLTCINALLANGFPADVEGTKLFQDDAGLEDTGVIGSDEFSILIQVFEPDRIQYIYEYLNELKTGHKKVSAKTSVKTRNTAIVWLIICLVVMFVGWYDIIKWILGLIF